MQAHEVCHVFHGVASVAVWFGNWISVFCCVSSLNDICHVDFLYTFFASNLNWRSITCANAVHHINISICQRKQKQGCKCRQYWLGSTSHSPVFFSPLWIWNNQDQYFSISSSMGIVWLHGHRWPSCQTMGSGCSHLINFKILGLILSRRTKSWGMGWPHFE